VLGIWRYGVALNCKADLQNISTWKHSVLFFIRKDEDRLGDSVIAD